MIYFSLQPQTVKINIAVCYHNLMPYYNIPFSPKLFQQMSFFHLLNTIQLQNIMSQYIKFTILQSLLFLCLINLSLTQIYSFFDVPALNSNIKHQYPLDSQGTIAGVLCIVAGAGNLTIDLYGKMDRFRRNRKHVLDTRVDKSTNGNIYRFELQTPAALILKVSLLNKTTDNLIYNLTLQLKLGSETSYRQYTNMFTTLSRQQISKQFIFGVEQNIDNYRLAICSKQQAIVRICGIYANANVNEDNNNNNATINNHGNNRMCYTFSTIVHAQKNGSFHLMDFKIREFNFSYLQHDLVYMSVYLPLNHQPSSCAIILNKYLSVHNLQPSRSQIVPDQSTPSLKPLHIGIIVGLCIFTLVSTVIAIYCCRKYYQNKRKAEEEVRLAAQLANQEALKKRKERFSKRLNEIRSKIESQRRFRLDSEIEDQICPICLERACDSYLPCLHTFHYKCIYQFSVRKQIDLSCPCCRKPFRIRFIKKF